MTECHLCKHTELEDLYGELHRQIGYRFRRCRGCGLIQAEQTHSRRDEERFYAEQYYALDHKGREYATRLGVFDRLIAHLDRLTGGRDLLDAGCGPGDFVAAACRRGWRAEGVDLSPEAAEKGMQRHGVSLHVGSIADWPGTGRLYDVVTFWNVLDQLPSPSQGLAAARRLLKPGGWVAIRVPNGTFHHAFRSLCCRWPWAVRRFRLADYFSVHLFSFTPRTLLHLLHRQGFVQLRVVNAPVTSGDPAGRLRGVQTIYLDAAKRGMFGISEALRVISCDRWCVAPSIFAVGRLKKEHNEIQAGKFKHGALYGDRQEQLSFA